MERKICKILKNENLSGNYYFLILENNFKKIFKPGNFIHIKIGNNFLRRPFSIALFDREKIGIIYKVVGKGTDELRKKKKGEFLDILGPCGNFFPIYKNKKVCIIGGGTGIAPLIFLSKVLKKYGNDVYFFYGARDKNLIFFKLLLTGINYIFSTDNGSYGKKGNIFDVFKNFEENFQVIYGAGPEILLKKLSIYSENIPVYISVENYMACGMGLCYGCVIRIRKNNGYEYKRVCKDGPVFKASEIIWD
ncbi:MAG: dihydroorotate dehydrogenase electron transfer subunit [Candidatus Omnitrophica bacterium]|nr:dihydroorotate dehydrogenase electron transfer subunit [Candidatus Omnitrophota bacterium]